VCSLPPAVHVLSCDVTWQRHTAHACTSAGSVAASSVAPQSHTAWACQHQQHPLSLQLHQTLLNCSWQTTTWQEATPWQQYMNGSMALHVAALNLSACRPPTYLCCTMAECRHTDPSSPKQQARHSSRCRTIISSHQADTLACQEHCKRTINT
jgi:hypothetical protein